METSNKYNNCQICGIKTDEEKLQDIEVRSSIIKRKYHLDGNRIISESVESCERNTDIQSCDKCLKDLIYCKSHKTYSKKDEICHFCQVESFKNK